MWIHQIEDVFTSYIQSSGSCYTCCTTVVIGFIQLWFLQATVANILAKYAHLCNRGINIMGIINCLLVLFKVKSIM